MTYKDTNRSATQLIIVITFKSALMYIEQKKKVIKTVNFNSTR